MGQTERVSITHNFLFKMTEIKNLSSVIASDGGETARVMV